MTRIDTTATTQTANTNFSFFLGGSGAEGGTGITVDSAGGVYIVGSTASGNFPTTAGAFQNTLSGPSDAFVTKLGPAINLAMSVAVTPTTPIGAGGQATFTYSIVNNGDFVPGATVVVNLPSTDTASVISVSGTGCPATPVAPLLRARWDRLHLRRQRWDFEHPNRCDFGATFAGAAGHYLIAQQRGDDCASFPFS